MQIVTGYKGQAHISSNDEQGKNQGIFGTGSYVMNIGNKFSPTAVTANEIQIADGEGIIQGVHFRVDPGTYDTVTIENGEQGLQRKDLIVCRYTKDSSTSIENTEWVVIKGTPAASNPARPAYITGDILAGAVEADMPMYEVVLNGINLSAINPLFSTIVPQAELLSRISNLNSNIAVQNVGTYNGQLRGCSFWVTSGTQQLSIAVPLALSKQITNASITRLSIALRTGNAYVGGSVDYDALAYVKTVTPYPIQGLLYIVCEKTDGWGVGNNVSGAGAIGVTVAFS